MIFKAYDVRGLYPQEFNEEIACKIVNFFVKKYGIESLALGRDVRNSSSSILEKIALSVPVNKTISYGLIPTPIFFNFSKHHDGGVLVTASHNPPEYNGLKFSFQGKSLRSEEIAELSESLNQIKECPQIKQRVVKVDKKQYLEKYKSFLYKHVEKFDGTNVIVDYANGSMAYVGKDLLGEVIAINDHPDGSFPAHLPDPSKPSNLSVLIDMVKEKGYLGVGFDGDGDRIGIVAEDGSFITGDKVLAVLASYLSEKFNKKIKVVTEVNVSKGVVEFLESKGIKVHITKVGRVNIEEEMHEKGYDIGGELSGHFYFNLDGEVYEDAILALHLLKEFLSHKGLKMKDTVKEIPFYYSTPPIRVKLNNWEMQEKMLNHLAQNYEDLFDNIERVITIDGLRVEMPNGWFIMRKSNTEPVIALRVEGKDKKDVDQILEKLNNAFSKFGINFSQE
ncbi:MAG: hypothetical protein GXN99_01320 [Candidatus Nanohaloarchaeota archaeon]|nr:hypothetical protein [Candidatus Nanohaloarchaeota archaeon]